MTKEAPHSFVSEAKWSQASWPACATQSSLNCCVAAMSEETNWTNDRSRRGMFRRTAEQPGSILYSSEPHNSVILATDVSGDTSSTVILAKLDTISSALIPLNVTGNTAY